MELEAVKADEYLENLNAKSVQNIEAELSKNEAWRRVVEYLGRRNFLSDESLNMIQNSSSPVKKLLDTLILDKQIKVEVLQRILEDCHLYDILRIINTCDPAKILVPNEDETYFVTLGAEVSISVTVSGSPFPEMLWYLEDNPLMGKTSSVLLLENFRKEDVGEYTCRIRQKLNGREAETTSHKYILKMKDSPPRISEDLKDVEVEAYEDLTLSFKVTGYPEPKNFMWFKGNNGIFSESNLPQLRIRGADVHASGEYYCEAFNQVGSCTTRTARVKVQESVICPKKLEIIQQPSASPDYYVGDWIYFTCEVLCGDHNVKFTCFLNDKVLKVSTDVRLDTLSSNNRHMCELKYRLIQENMEKENLKQLNFKFAVASSSDQVLSDDVKVAVKSRNVPRTYFARNKWALLIGNSQYQQMSHLPAPRNDIIIMMNSLTELDFHVMMLHDLKRDAVQNAVIFFSSFIQKGDYVTFFYAGHGIHDGGKDYIIPLDANMKLRQRNQNINIREPDISLDECISYVDITNHLQKNKPALIFSVYDTCRQPKQKFENWQPHSSQDVFQTALKNSFFLFATSENYEAFEERIVDTSLLVLTLQDLITNKISVQDLCKTVLMKFHYPVKEWGHKQVPKISGDLALPLSLTDPARPQEIDESESGVLKKWEQLASGRGKMEESIQVGDVKVEANVYWNIEPQKDGVTRVITNCLPLTVDLFSDATEIDVQIKLSTQDEKSLKLRGSLSEQFLIPHLQYLEKNLLVELYLAYKGLQCKKEMYLERPAFSQMFLK